MALTEKLTAIADAIRSQSGKGEKLTLDQMPNEIISLQSLSFEVVGNPQPVDPKENTIWVDTDEPITGWVFSATEPVKKVDNLISFPAANTQKTYNGITFVYNGDGTFTLNGTLTTNGDLRLIEPLELEWTAGEKYTFSARHISGTVEMADGGSNTFAFGIFQSDAAKYVRGSINMTEFPEVYSFTATAFEPTDANKHLILYLQCWRQGTVFDNYRFSVQLEAGEKATEPDGIADEGYVWIATGESSPVEFNALKKNGVMVYPLSAQQLVGGELVTKTAKSYQGGAWVDWITWLYNSGNEFTALTGGWEEKHYGTDSTKKGIVKDADRITVSVARTSGVHQESIAGTVNAVDLTNVNFIRATIAGYASNGSAKYNRIGVYADSIREPAAYANPGADGTVELDISALTGLHYVFFGICTLWNSGNVTAKYEVTDIRFD